MFIELESVTGTTAVINVNQLGMVMHKEHFYRLYLHTMTVDINSSQYMKLLDAMYPKEINQ